jgi:uncharacterized protein (DUF488 family)
MEIYTIGFTKKSAGEFFEILKRNGIRLLIDIRLNNTSQLAAFAKRDDLEYFLKEICAADYLHEPRLAPTLNILDKYRAKSVTWWQFETDFKALLDQRKIHEVIDRDLFSQPAVLLCSESKADKCHRRLVAEYLREKWGDINIIHL